MIPWTAKNDWMEFPRLSVCGGLHRTYTLAYRLTDNSSEKWTARFNRFKNDEPKALVGGARLFYEAFPPLFEALKLRGRDTVFVSALSSAETEADRERQIPFITAELADLVGARDGIDAITKQRHGKIHNLYRSGERDAELAKANYVSERLPARNVFVFDDFVTRGGTLSKIAQAVHASNPGSTVYGIALAKTERIAYCYNPENDQVPAKWNKVWTDGEKEVA